ncbi:MAG: hypothetical protein QM730_15975 [Anaerolineales bacterium]
MREKSEVHRIGMVACFISEIEQDQFLGIENCQQGMEAAQTGNVPEWKKDLYPYRQRFIILPICPKVEDVPVT